ncbi:hypothetical protein KST09_04375 [Fusobacterium animalis]|uniref:hypothetical protein n=1 Tax=Fusobacterium animalis TaxID=76859 RepID=UPI0030CE7AAE
MKIEASEKLKAELSEFSKFIKYSEISEGLKKEIMKKVINLINISSKESFIKGGEHIINKLKSQKKGIKNEN